MKTMKAKKTNESRYVIKRKWPKPSGNGKAMEHITMRVPKDMYDDIAQLAAETGRTISEVTRIALTYIVPLIEVED